ncbi:apolipoprotein M-like [Leuresthes tenuis]|uniref:apolipoprotein M-like n=1 Tax=Leuresthes tenuis TaxID=355514 RepID=UPI003B5152B8
MEKTASGAVLLTGHMRKGDDCIKQNWTFHVQPDRDDLVLEGKPQRRTLLWSGSWANCLDCIILQEIEPPLTETDSEDSLGRFMLYSRQAEVNSEMVAAFLRNADCSGFTKSVKPAQEKEFCT